MEWDLHTPILNPPNNKPGWFFISFDRSHELYSLGPYPTREYCARVIATETRCESCKRCPIFHDEFDDPPKSPSVKRAEDRWGRRLCVMCARDFTRWHKKTYGRPPKPLTVIPESYANTTKPHVPRPNQRGPRTSR